MARKKKKKSNAYWTLITECAISAYNQCQYEPILKERIYKRFIYPPLLKMAENLINKIKPEYIRKEFKELQIDLVVYLTERLDKFDPIKGRAYSYYTRTSFHYLWAENQKAYNKLKSNTDPIDVDINRNVTIEMYNDEMRETLKYFMDAFVESCYANLNIIFTNPVDIHVAESVLHLFETRDIIEEFNKKALYIFIRERTGLETNNITKVVKVLKELYQKKWIEYEQTEFINLPF